MTRGRRQVDWFVFNIGAPTNTSRPLLALNVTARWVIFPRPIRLWTPPRSHFYYFPVCVCVCVICCVLSQQFFTFRILLILFLLLTKPRFNFPVVRPPNVSFLYLTHFYNKRKKKHTRWGWGDRLRARLGGEDMMIDRCRTPAANFELPNANLPTRKHRHTVVIMSLFLSFLLSFKRYPKKITNKSRRKNRKKKETQSNVKSSESRRLHVSCRFHQTWNDLGIFFSFFLGRFPSFHFLFMTFENRGLCVIEKQSKKEKDKKKFTYTPFNEQVSSIFLLFKKNCIYTLYFPFIVIPVCNFTREQTKVRVWFVSLNDTFFSLFPDFYCCATIERRKNTWKCGGRIEELWRYNII